MRRLVVLSLLALLVPVAVALAQQPQKPPPPVTLAKIAGNIYEIRGGRGATGGAYIGQDAVLLIDAKQDEASVKQVLDQVAALTKAPIKFVVNTHADGDHLFGNRFYPASATFIAHENLKKEAVLPSMRGEPSDWNKPELAQFLPSKTFRDKMEFSVGAERVQLWYFGIGHSTADIVVYFPAEKVAFIGDQVRWPPLIHAYKGGNSFAMVANLKKMLETLDAQQFSAGHTDMTDRKGIQAHIDRLQALQAKVQDLQKKGVPVEAAQKEFPANEGTLVGVIYEELSKK